MTCKILHEVFILVGVQQLTTHLSVFVFRLIQHKSVATAPSEYIGPEPLQNAPMGLSSEAVAGGRT